MTKEEKELTITYLTKMQEEYIEGEGYERHPLPEYYALDMAIKALEQQKLIEKFENVKDHIYKLAGDYKCWDNRLTEEEAVELCQILEQQPSDDKVTITMNKGTVKYSDQEYVVYNKDWFRKHFATEVKIMTGYDGYINQPTSDDDIKTTVEDKEIDL